MDYSMATSSLVSGGFASLKAGARQQKGDALDTVARQFEAMVTQTMLRTMRQASLGEGAFESEQTKLYQDLYDQQITQRFANRSNGLGLAQAIRRQLEPLQNRATASVPPGNEAPPAKTLADYRTTPTLMVSPPTPALPRATPAFATASDPPKNVNVPAKSAGTEGTPEASDGWDSPEDFVRDLWPWAREAAARVGLQPAALLAQAALETGWGSHIIEASSGATSHNLFGIKAHGGWNGERVRVPTVEFENGLAVRKQAEFRAYGSFQESFQDYADFITGNPRYQKAVAQAGDPASYFEGLQKAGYATDPGYARKLKSILSSGPMRRALADVQGSAAQSL
ncbi:flagellar protein FlgJ [Gammaproteobacteria bacterium]